VVSLPPSSQIIVVSLLPSDCVAQTQLTLRMITTADEMMVPRMWPFFDRMAARSDTTYSLHLLGPYRGDEDAIRTRDYVHRSLPRQRKADEVWLLRGWNTLRLVHTAYAARARHIPLMLWHEPPGRTWAATTFRRLIRIRARETLLPIIFRAYRGCVLLGIGELAVQRFGTLAPGSRVYCVPYPDDQADALLSSNHVRLHEPRRLLFVGEFSYRKAVDVLATACEGLWHEGADFRIRYVGRGPLEQALQEHAARSGGRAEVIPHTSGETLLNLFWTSDGLVLPSRWDGWGLVVHEALAAGLPVVVSHTCGAKILVGDSGRVARAGDAASLVDGMRWCLDLSDAERQSVARAARVVAREITSERIADEIVSRAEEALRITRRSAGIRARRARSR
jgi:glycosyltransferase involved in cell wall biosynthesis